MVPCVFHMFKPLYNMAACPGFILNFSSCYPPISLTVASISKQPFPVWCELSLRWRKEWICSERPITIYALWRRAGHDRGFWSGISVKSGGNKDQSGLSYHLHYRETCLPVPSEHAQSTTFGLLVEAIASSGWPASFISTSFYLSKVEPRTIAVLWRLTTSCLYWSSREAWSELPTNY